MSKVRFTTRCNTGLCIFEVYFVSKITIGVEIYVHIQIASNCKLKESNGEYAYILMYANNFYLII